MAKLPKELNKYCPTCNTAVKFKVKEAAKNARSSLNAIERRKDRRGTIGNLGKFSKVPAKKIKKSKRPSLVITCTKCNNARNYVRPRLIKFQLI